MKRHLRTDNRLASSEVRPDFNTRWIKRAQLSTGAKSSGNGWERSSTAASYSRVTRSCSSRSLETATRRNGRREENFNPVENENCGRHSGGMQLTSPAITCSAGGPPTTATVAEPSAAWTSAASQSGPGLAHSRAKSDESTAAARPASLSGSSRLG